MTNNYVGAGILNIITESLYDNPIVVFREYVQNSMDSILKEECQDGYEIKIWFKGDNLYFLDNGSGIEPRSFFEEMIKIGGSNKKKQRNIGYKGIGRLSGVPYCQKLYFINIVDYSKSEFQMYTIDDNLYEEIKIKDQDVFLSFSELMEKIGKFYEKINYKEHEIIFAAIDKYHDIIKKTNSGFLVILQEVSSVLQNTIESEDFLTNLQWLLPVDFDKDLYNSSFGELFQDLTTLSSNDAQTQPIRYCSICYNDNPIYRPIKKEMLRDYVCKNNFKYAIGFHSFKGDKIFIDKNNAFTGIRIYIDNMLLCDENEILQNLENYGLLSHTLNGQLQSVRGIGAIIYITDKVNISANARRTFIEVIDNDSLEFLRLLAEFVNTVYDTRYALSNYVSAKAKQEKNAEKMQSLKSYALENLRKLAKENIELTIEDASPSFKDLSLSEKKRAIKNRIVSQFDIEVKDYLKTFDSFNLETAFLDFVAWLKGDNKKL